MRTVFVLGCRILQRVGIQQKQNVKFTYNREIIS